MSEKELKSVRKKLCGTKFASVNKGQLVMIELFKVIDDLQAQINKLTKSKK